MGGGGSESQALKAEPIPVTGEWDASPAQFISHGFFLSTVSLFTGFLLMPEPRAAVLQPYKIKEVSF